MGRVALHQLKIDKLHLSAGARGSRDPGAKG